MNNSALAYGNGGTTMTIQVGDPAIDFELNDSAGQAHRLVDYRGHWVLLVFHRHLG